MEIFEYCLFTIPGAFILTYIILGIYEYRFKLKLFEKYETTTYLGASGRQKIVLSLAYFAFCIISIVLFFIEEGLYIAFCFLCIPVCILLISFIFSDLQSMDIITKKELILMVKRKEYLRINLVSIRFFSIHKKLLNVTYRFYDINHKEVYATDEGFDHMELLFNATRAKYIPNREDELKRKMK